MVSWLSRIEVLRQTGQMALALIDRKSKEVGVRSKAFDAFFVSRMRANRFCGL